MRPTASPRRPSLWRARKPSYSRGDFTSFPALIRLSLAAAAGPRNKCFPTLPAGRRLTTCSGSLFFCAPAGVLDSVGNEAEETMKLTLFALGTVGTAGTCALQCESVRAALACVGDAICIALGIQ